MLIKVSGIKESIAEIQAAANSDTKSSAGDKHETARAMAHLEKEQLSKQLHQLILLKEAIEKINAQQVTDQVGLGSYVCTEEGDFYISVGLGQLKQDDTCFYAIALHSPVGKSMQGKTVGESFLMGKKEVLIKAVY